MPRGSNHCRLARFTAGSAKRVSRIRTAEIDHHIAGADVFRYVVTKVERRRDIDVHLLRSSGDGLAHAAFPAQQEDARLHATSANASSVLRSRAWFAGVISHNGKRHSADIAPRQESAV